MSKKHNTIRHLAISILILTITTLSLAQTPNEPNPEISVFGLSEMNSPSFDVTQTGTTILAWFDASENSPDTTIYYQRIDDHGNTLYSPPIVAATIFSPTTLSELEISSDTTGNFIITWIEDNQYIKARAFKRTSNELTLNASPIFTVHDFGSTQSNINHQISHSKSTFDQNGNFIIAWNGEDTHNKGIYAQVYSIDYTDPDFTTSYTPEKTHDNPVLVNTDENNDQYNPSLTTAPLGSIIAWNDNTDNSVWYRVITHDNVGSGNPFFDTAHKIPGTTSATEVSVSAINRYYPYSTPPTLISFTLSYTENNNIYLHKISCTNDPTNNCAPSNPLNSSNISVRATNTTPNIENSKPSITVFQDDFQAIRTGTSSANSADYIAVTWQEYNTNQSTYSLKSQLYGDNLHKYGSTITHLNQSFSPFNPKSVLDLDGDLTTGTYSFDDNNFKIFRTVSDLHTIIPEHLINTQNGANQDSPSSSASSNGNYAIAFTSTENDGGDIFFKLYNKSGTLLKTNIANTSTGTQNQPSISFFTDDNNSPYQGYFIIAWSGNGPGDTNGIFYRIFDNHGLPVTSEIRANTDNAYEPYEQLNPVVKAGIYQSSEITYREFTIIWDGEQDTDSNGGITIFYQNDQINSGNPIIERANSTTTDIQELPDITLHPNSPASPKLIATWIDRKDNTIKKIKASPSGSSLNLEPEEIVISDNATQTVTENRPSISSSIIDTDLFYSIVFTNTSFEFSEITSYRIQLISYIFNNPTPTHDFIMIQNLLPFARTDTTFHEPKISLEQYGGNGIIVFSNMIENEDNYSYSQPTINKPNVFAKFIKFDPDTYTHSSFGHSFKLNQYQTESQFEPTVFMNSSGPEDNDKFVITAWTNNGTNDRYDNNGIYGRLLTYPFYIGASPLLSGSVTLDLNATGKFLVAPNIINFGTVPIGQTSNPIKTRPDGGITIIDLDGSPLSLTVSATDLELDSDPTKTIPKENLKVQNCDTDTPEIQEIQNTPGNPTPEFTLSESTECTGPFIELDSPKTLGEKNTYSTGHWEIFPQFTLTIPNTQNSEPTTPGIYTGTIIFTLI